MPTDLPAEPARTRRNPIWATLKALFRTRITAGLLVVLPIWITYLLVTFLFGVMRDASQWVVELVLRSQRIEAFMNHIGVEWKALGSLAELPVGWRWGISIFSVFLTIFALYAIGLFTANIFGRRIIETVERFLERVPLVKTVYRSSKQILVTLTGEPGRKFQRVALIPFPQERMRCVGFVTSTFHDSVSGEELATVFIPTTPNPTTGYLQVVRRSDLVEVDWTVEQAVQVIMSAGILRPDHVTIVPDKDRAHYESSSADAPPAPRGSTPPTKWR